MTLYKKFEVKKDGEQILLNMHLGGGGIEVDVHRLSRDEALALARALASVIQEIQVKAVEEKPKTYTEAVQIMQKASKILVKKAVARAPVKGKRK